MASRIRDLKNQRDQQTEYIKSANLAKKQLWSEISSIYQTAVKYKSEFKASATGIETDEFPDIRNEDLANLQSHDIVKKFGHVFKVMAQSLNENRSEIRAMYKELDDDLENSTSEWDAIRMQDANEKKSEVFRSNLVTTASAARSQTPDLVASKPRDDFGPALPPTPPSAPGKKEPIQSNSAGKQKGATTTLENMFTSSGAKTTASKDPKKR